MSEDGAIVAGILCFPHDRLPIFPRPNGPALVAASYRYLGAGRHHANREDQIPGPTIIIS